MAKKHKLEFEDPKTIDFTDLPVGTRLIIEESFKRGIKVSKEIGKFRIIEYKGKRHIIGAQEVDSVGRLAVRITDEKQVCKDFLSIGGLSVPKGSVFKSDELEAALKYFNDLGSCAVCKPSNSDYGNHVFLNVDSTKKLKKAFQIITSKGHTLLMEEQFSGKDVRIFITEKGYICAILRVPANVVGDGTRTIAGLVKIKNKEKLKQLPNCCAEKYMVNLGNIEKSNLKEKGLTPKSVPKKGEKVFLRYNSNLSTGGDSIDITEQLHPSIKKIAMKVLKSISGLRYAGIDLVIKTPLSSPLGPEDYRIIEVNNMPGIRGHHMPCKGKARNPAGAILDLVFPQSKK